MCAGGITFRVMALSRRPEWLTHPTQWKGSRRRTSPPPPLFALRRCAPLIISDKRLSKQRASEWACKQRRLRSLSAESCNLLALCTSAKDKRFCVPTRRSLGPSGFVLPREVAQAVVRAAYWSPWNRTRIFSMAFVCISIMGAQPEIAHCSKPPPTLSVLCLC